MAITFVARAMVIDKSFFLNLPGECTTTLGALDQIGIREKVFSAFVLVRIS
jgi:hypothetical protein